MLQWSHCAVRRFDSRQESRLLWLIRTNGTEVVATTENETDHSPALVPKKTIHLHGRSENSCLICDSQPQRTYNNNNDDNDNDDDNDNTTTNNNNSNCSYAELCRMKRKHSTQLMPTVAGAVSRTWGAKCHLGVIFLHLARLPNWNYSSITLIAFISSENPAAILCCIPVETNPLRDTCRRAGSLPGSINSRVTCLRNYD